jgi:hypothetical protein
MTDDPTAAKIDAEKIRLVSIIDEQLSEGQEGKTVTLRYQTHGGDSLTATFVVGQYQVRDESLVSVARDWLHKTCRDIARATEGWALDGAQLKAAEHPRKYHPY